METVRAQMARIVQVADRQRGRAAAAEGLGTAEFEMVQAVRANPGISQKDVCELLGTDKGAATRRITSLEKKGYLKRKANPNDGRSQLLVPGERADSLTTETDVKEEEFCVYLMEALSEEEGAQFADMLSRLKARAEQYAVRLSRPDEMPKKKVRRLAAQAAMEALAEAQAQAAAQEAEASGAKKSPAVWLL